MGKLHYDRNTTADLSLVTDAEAEQRRCHSYTEMYDRCSLVLEYWALIYSSLPACDTRFASSSNEFPLVSRATRQARAPASSSGGNEKRVIRPGRPITRIPSFEALAKALAKSSIEVSIRRLCIVAQEKLELAI